MRENMYWEASEEKHVTSSNQKMSRDKRGKTYLRHLKSLVMRLRIICARIFYIILLQTKNQIGLELKGSHSFSVCLPCSMCGRSCFLMFSALGCRSGGGSLCFVLGEDT